MSNASPSSKLAHILVIYGTRPEAIKLAPLIDLLRQRERHFRTTVCTTSQHREMLEQVHEVFAITADIDLGLMYPDQSLNGLMARCLAAVDEVLQKLRPDWVLVQGDTTSATAAALASFQRGIAVGHVEAGLRTGDLAHPFPEEANRRIIDTLATVLFAPTDQARQRLVAEGIEPSRIHVTGNTVIDALHTVAGKVGDCDGGEPCEVLVTVHRRESFGRPLRRILAAVRELAEHFVDHRWIYPVHLNPNVSEPARKVLADLPNVDLCPPLDYLELVAQLKRCRLVLTDSGGLQEEAPTFGKPVLVLRDTTERPEGIAAGVAQLVGSDPSRIVTEVHRLLTDERAYAAMARVVNPYGDGHAAERIVAALEGEAFEPFGSMAGEEVDCDTTLDSLIGDGGDGAEPGGQLEREEEALQTDLQKQLAALSEQRRALANEVKVMVDQELSAVRQRESELRREVSSLKRALDSIYDSNLWRIADRYWRFRRLLNRLLPGIQMPEDRTWTTVAGNEARQEQGAQPMSTAWDAKSQNVSVSQAVPASSTAIAKGGGRFDIILLPIIDWELRYQRPQQMMTQFTRRGHRVFYARTKFQQRSNHPQVKFIQHLVYGVRLPGDEDRDLYSQEMTSIDRQRCFNAINELRSLADIRDAVIFVQLPAWRPLALEMRDHWGWKIVYDCLDDVGDFKNINEDAIRRQERSMLIECDLALASSMLLHERVSRLSTRAELVRNAADFEHFRQAPPSTPADIQSLEEPVIGYYGAISYWFDVQMVHTAAQAHPEWNWVLIGDTWGADIDLLEGIANIYLLGEKPYSELPAYLHHFDVATIPFLITPLTKATNPVKFYEYLSAGKPIVSTSLPELKPYRDFFYSANDPDEFVLQVERALAEDDLGSVTRRIQFAASQTWDSRYSQVIAAIESLYPAAAIVIFLGDEPHNLCRCLESIWEKTTYPCFEVIVVDTGVSRDLTTFLEILSVRERRLKVIQGQRNFNLAQGSYIGVRAATNAEYIVLLSTETAVTRGWLRGLIRHLHRPSVALVGPESSSEGVGGQNQAVSRDDLDEFAEEHFRLSEGLFFEVESIELDCVAMQRSLLAKFGIFNGSATNAGIFEADGLSRRVREVGGRIVCAKDVIVHNCRLSVPDGLNGGVGEGKQGRSKKK